MKKYIPIFLLSVYLIASFPSKASADDDEVIAAIGGFLGGIITGAILLEDDRHESSKYRKSASKSCQKEHFHEERYSCQSRKSDYRSSGYWTVKKVRVWIPGKWKIRYNDCGQKVKIWRPGHYKWKRERVWVDTSCGKYRRLD